MCGDETTEYSVCNGWSNTEMLAKRNFADCHKAVTDSKVTWELGTENTDEVTASLSNNCLTLIKNSA